MKRLKAFAAMVLGLAAMFAHADTPTVGDLIDAEATHTLHQMTDNDKTAAAGAAGLPGAGAPTAPLPTAQSPDDGKPKHPDGLFARFGVVPNLSGYLMWNDVIYQVSVGRKVKGWTVTAINADGVDLRSRSGQVKHFDSLLDPGLDSDAGVAASQSQTQMNVGMPRAPMPPGVPSMIGGRAGSTMGVH